MKYSIIEKGQNYKGLWVVEVIDNEINYPVSIRNFARKASMKKWLKTQTEYK